MSAFVDGERNSLGLLPYKMWSAYFRRRENIEPNMDSGKKLAVYIAIALLASTACAVIIAWFVDLLGLIPFTVALILILFNNAIMGIVLGPILLRALYPRVKRWGLLWTEIMNPEEVSASRFRRIGNLLVWIGVIGAVVVGLILGLSEEAPGGFGIGIGLIPSLVLSSSVASCSAGGSKWRPLKSDSHRTGECRNI
jgi:energy-coupling factor transport system substrate-specific component